MNASEFSFRKGTSSGFSLAFYLFSLDVYLIERSVLVQESKTLIPIKSNKLAILSQDSQLHCRSTQRVQLFFVQNIHDIPEYLLKDWNESIIPGNIGPKSKKRSTTPRICSACKKQYRSIRQQHAWVNDAWLFTEEKHTDSYFIAIMISTTVVPYFQTPNGIKSIWNRRYDSIDGFRPAGTN